MREIISAEQMAGVAVIVGGAEGALRLVPELYVGGEQRRLAVRRDEAPPAAGTAARSGSTATSRRPAHEPVSSSISLIIARVRLPTGSSTERSANIARERIRFGAFNAIFCPMVPAIERPLRELLHSQSRHELQEIISPRDAGNILVSLERLGRRRSPAGP